MACFTVGKLNQSLANVRALYSPESEITALLGNLYVYEGAEHRVRRGLAERTSSGQWSVKQPGGRRLVWMESSAQQAPSAEEDIGQR